MFVKMGIVLAHFPYRKSHYSLVQAGFVYSKCEAKIGVFRAACSMWQIGHEITGQALAMEYNCSVIRQTEVQSWRASPTASMRSTLF